MTTTSHMEHLNQQLIALGLGDHEARVLSTLIQSSPASATSIAKQNNLSRSSVYTTLSSLIAKGLVGTTYKNEVKQFIAQDYASIEQMLISEKKKLDDKFQTLTGLKTIMESLGSSGLNIPQIIFFEGQEGLKKIYLSMMRQAGKNSTLYLLRDEFVWQPDWNFIFKQEWHGKVKKIKTEKNIKTRLLVNNSTVEKQKAKLYKGKVGLEFKYLPAKHSVKGFAIYIIADIVSILSFEKNNLVGIKITNQHMADNFKAVFEGLWNS